VRFSISNFILISSLFLVACSNKLDISKGSGNKSYTFKSFNDSVASLTFSSKESVSEALKEAFEGKSPDVVSHLTADRVLLANLNGKSVLVDLASKSSAQVSLPFSGNGTSEWRIAFDKEFFWGVSGDKLLYKGNGGVGDDISTIENSMSEILEDQAGGLRPLAATASSLIAMSGNKLVVLNAVPQLRREVFLELDSASLANNSPAAVKSAGFIGERGFWLQVDGYLVYLLKDGSGSVSAQFSRLPEFKSEKGPLSGFRMSGFFQSDENSVISQVGQILLSSGGRIYTAGTEQIVAGGTEGDSGGGGSNSGGDIQDPQPTTPTPTPTPNVVTLEQLQTQYDSKFKAILDNRCVACHAGRQSRWNNFNAVKLYADQGSSRVESGDMPRGGTLSNTDKSELTKFLKDLARLP
jgi:hypothetical protein